MYHQDSKVILIKHIYCWKIRKCRYPVFKSYFPFSIYSEIYFFLILFSIMKYRLYLMYHQDSKVILIKHIYWIVAKLGNIVIHF